MELTREQIKEGNEKLAKLIGWYQEEPSISGTWFENTEFAKYVAYSVHNNYPHQDLPFHRDWNYLMKVVDKIGTIVYHRTDDAPEWNWKEHYSYSELFREIFNKWLHHGFEEHKQGFNLMNDLTSIWCGCVTYVDWYKQNKDEE
jgi:hypothetical protein